MPIVTLDLEGVLVPEIWIAFSEKTGIQELSLTTRDIPDYDELMKRRLRILKENKLGLPDIQDVIAKITPLEGAGDFLEWLRSKTQLIILSDTFQEFAHPLMKQLGWPTLFCHSLQVGTDGSIENYCLRQKDQKRVAVKALQSLNFEVIASGDSFNDLGMLEQANYKFWFQPPISISEKYSNFKVCNNYADLKNEIEPLLVNKNINSLKNLNHLQIT